MEPDESATGLPLLRTWREVYIVVFVVFILTVASLTALTFSFR